MAIHISEPGRPTATRLPEQLRNRRVGSLDGTAGTAALRESNDENTSSEFQQARGIAARQAAARYGETGDARPKPQQAYLPVSRVYSPRIYTLPAEATLAEGLAVMDQHGVQHLVITSDGVVGGLVDMRWILNWLHENRDQDASRTFLTIELPSFLTASPETDAHMLARLMLAHQLDAALVVGPDNAPVGMITSTDYLRLYASLNRQEDQV